MKHPENVHETGLPFGRATLFFPEAGEDRCTAALTVEVDPGELVRGRGRGPAIEEQYVSDRSRSGWKRSTASSATRR